MFKKVSISALVIASSITAQAAFAGADCPAAPQDTWMSELDMQKKIINEYGYSIRKFKVDGNCYEIYGMAQNKDNPKRPSKVEIYFNPVNGEIVKQKIEG